MKAEGSEEEIRTQSRTLIPHGPDGDPNAMKGALLHNTKVNAAVMS